MPGGWFLLLMLVMAGIWDSQLRPSRCCFIDVGLLCGEILSLSGILSLRLTIVQVRIVILQSKVQSDAVGLLMATRCPVHSHARAEEWHDADSANCRLRACG